VPLRERNRLLEAAGLAAEYRSVPPGAPDLAPYEAAVQRVLALHEPYPGLAVDRHWNVTLANRGSELLIGRELIGTNLVRRYLGVPSAAESIVNWPAVAWAGVNRLRDQVEASPFDDELRELLALAEAAVGNMDPPPPSGDDLVVCPHFRVDGEVIRTDDTARRFFAGA
jgi:MmyB-like transcription regulator ligand binding domain